MKYWEPMLCPDLSALHVTTACILITKYAHKSDETLCAVEDEVQFEFCFVSCFNRLRDDSFYWPTIGIRTHMFCRAIM